MSLFHGTLFSEPFDKVFLEVPFGKDPPGPPFAKEAAGFFNAFGSAFFFFLPFGSEISEKDSFCHGIREKYNALYYEVSKIQPPGGTSHGSRMMVRGSGMIIEV